MLRFASYNVHGYVGTDGVLDPQRIATAILALGADVVGLQEVPFERAEDGGFLPLGLLELLPGYRAVLSPVTRHDGYVHGNAFLTTAEIARAHSISLSVERREPRTALQVELVLAGRRCRILTTHLGLWPLERRTQVRALLRHLAVDEPELTVLLGDFNEWFLRGRPLRWLESYFGRGRALSTYPTRFPLVALDRIWVHPRKLLRSQQVPRQAPFDLASDHLPIVAEVDF